MDILGKFRRTIRRNSLLGQGDRLIVAVSGGADSLCLLHLLLQVSGEHGLQLAAAHFNHGLRGKEADEDELFVASVCRGLGVELCCGRADIKKIAAASKASIEEICREKRFDYLFSLMRDKGFNRIALGHTLDDQAETVLMNVIRGTGVDGLKGIEPRRDCLVRPLIDITRREIENYLEEREIPFRTDSSNLDNSLRRNRVRNELLPRLAEKYNPSIKETLSRLAGIARLENSFLEAEAKKVISRWETVPGGGYRFALEGFVANHEALCRRAVKLALEELSPVKGGISLEHVEAAMGVISSVKPGASLALPFRLSLRREYEFAVIDRGGGKTEDHEHTVPVPGTLSLPEAGVEFRFFLAGAAGDYGESADGRVAYIDFRKVVPPLVIRNARRGDRIQPFGMEGHRKLQDVFTDRKVPRGRRGRMLLLADSVSVLWVPGVVMSERARVTAQTSEVLRVERN